MLSQHYLAGCWGLLLLTTSLSAADDRSPADRAQARLRQQFDRADQNKDGFLDLAELARGVRDPHASPAPEWVYSPKDKPVRSFSVAKRFYPDVIYLWSRDTDSDHRVSWEEYLQYESIYRDSVAQNPRLTRREEELQLALQNLQGGSQVPNNFSTNLLASPVGVNPFQMPLSSTTPPLRAGYGGGLLPPGLNAGMPNLANPLAQGNFSPRVSVAGYNLTAMQLQGYEKYLAGFDQRYFRRFCGYFSPGTSPAYIRQQYLAYKKRALLSYLMRSQARNVGILP